MKSSISNGDHEFVVTGLSARLVCASYKLLTEEFNFEYDLDMYDIGIDTYRGNTNYWEVTFLPKHFIEGNPEPGEEWMHMVYVDVPQKVFVFEKATMRLVESYGGR